MRGIDVWTAGVAFRPERIDGDDPVKAREVLTRDGAVILTGWSPQPDSVVRAAAAVLGTRLRGLEEVRSRTTQRAKELALHSDGANVAVDIHDRRVQLRDPDIDYVLVLCETAAPAGGESFVADGYRLIERIREHDPELYDFLSGIDVDLTSGVGLSDVLPVPRVCRMLEWTRGGRMVLRAAPWARPRPRETRRDDHQRMLDAYTDVLTALTAAAPDSRLEPGEIQLLDNYRCPHGVRAHDGQRRTHVLRCKSAEAL